MIRRHLWLGLALLLPIGCNKGASADTPPSSSTPPLPPGTVQLEPPEMAALSIDTVRERKQRVVATLPAQLLLDEDKTVRVLSPVTGRVRTLDARPGDDISAGQPLLHIVSSDLAQAQSDKLKADAASLQSTTQLVRSESLYVHKVIALKDLEDARAQAAQGRAEAERAGQRVRQLAGGQGNEQSAPGDFVLRSPIAGEVVDRQANPGEEVSADAGNPLFTISALETLWVTAQAYEQNLTHVHRGQHLVFTTAAMPDHRYDAVVTYVGGALDSTTRTAIVRATLSNPGRVLKAATFGDVRLYAPDTSHVVAVPVTALVTSGQQTVVFVQTGPTRFLRTPVSVGDDDGEMASITDGLKAGELVVSRGSILLQGRLSTGS
jgi:cobalt-zinc-cadmium efflux system membrane fusion protein